MEFVESRYRRLRRRCARKLAGKDVVQRQIVKFYHRI